MREGLLHNLVILYSAVSCSLLLCSRCACISVLHEQKEWCTGVAAARASIIPRWLKLDTSTMPVRCVLHACSIIRYKNYDSANMHMHTHVLTELVSLQTHHMHMHTHY